MAALTITPSAHTFFKDATLNVSTVVGYESKAERGIRYTFTIPSSSRPAGATSYSFTKTENGFDGGGTQGKQWNYAVSTDASAYLDTTKAGDGSGNAGATFSGSKTGLTLFPDTTYYLFIYPGQSSTVSWYYWNYPKDKFTLSVDGSITYPVTYNANGGSGAPGDQTKTYGTTLKLSATKPTKGKSTSTYTVTYNTNGGSSISNGSATKTTTYTFTNWSGSDGETYASEASYTTNAALTLTANYSSTDSTTSVTLPTPTQDGKNFKGWYLKSDFSGTSYAAGAKYTPTGNTTFYAKWETKTYAISYNANGHGTAPTSQTKTHGTNLTLQPFISDQTETGYIVSYDANGGTSTPNASSATTITHKQTYWNTNKSGTGTNYGSKGTYSANSAATLYAIWSSSSSNVTLASAIKKNQTTKDGYKVTYDAQSGTCDKTSETAKDIVKYTFSKWAAGSATSSNKYDAGASYTPAANVTMYATWSESVTNGSVTLPTPTRDGYEFLGWVTSTSNGTNVGKGGTSYTPEKSLTLYAKWEQSTYTVIFDSNGGTGSMSDQSIKVGVSTKLSANAFSKTGYTFSGWSTTRNGTKKYSNQESVTDLAAAGKTYTLYAVWEANQYTVTYKSAAYNGETKTQTITYDTPWTTYPADTFSKTGNTIDSWNTRSGGTGTKYDVSKEYNTYQNLTLYAQWKAKTYTLSYDANKGNNPPGDQTWTYGSSTRITVSSQKPTREGYTFQGWAESANATSVAYNSGATISSTQWASDKTLYAVWTANTYTVIFDANGGTGEMDNQSFTYDKAQNLSMNEFTKAGFIFKGWTDSNDNTYSDKASVINLTTTQNGTVKMTAVWERGVYNLTIKPNGGTLLSNNTTNDITTKFAYKTLTYVGEQQLESIFYSINPSGYNSISISFSYGATLYYSNSCVDPNSNGGKLELSNSARLNSITSTYCNNNLKGKYILFNNQIYLIHENASFNGTTNSGNNRKLVCDQAALCSISEKPIYSYEPNNSAVKNDYIFTGYTASNGSVFQNTTGSSFYFDGGNEDNNDDWEMDTETYVFDGDATEDVTITAQFRKKNYTVQYELNNSKITDQSSFSEVHDYGDTFTLPSFATTQIYEFLGWNTAADGSGTAYNIGSQVSNLSDVDGATFTLYAQWKLKNLVQVHHGGKFENAQMFVWTNNQWTLATTYVWKSGDWAMSTGK